MDKRSMHEILTKVANQYPNNLADAEALKQEVKRIAFNIIIALNSTKEKLIKELEICDLGGGLGLFSTGCAAIGMKRVLLIDDFDDPVNHRVGDSIFEIHKKLGVNVIKRDFVEIGINDIPGKFDIITTFDSMEHWHNSPKMLFKQVVEKLKANGVFVLGVPNCVNMRKRITVPLGFGKWSSMYEWYESKRFRDHVREPDVEDLKYIARDMGLNNIKIYGRNWLGYRSTNPAIRFATKIMDYPLRLKPSFCADIYIVGTKG